MKGNEPMKRGVGRLLRRTVVIVAITAMTTGSSMVNTVIETYANDDTSINATSAGSTYLMLRRIST